MSDQAEQLTNELNGLTPGEWALVQARRTAAELPPAKDRSELIGLALSGGGIRSATFSLGLLQSLAKANLLKRVDYLSTVSGGGYTGAFLGSLYKRTAETGGPATQTPEQVLTADFARRGAASPDPSPGWSLQWLRKSSRYLAPSGAGDFLYAVAMDLRNIAAVHYVLGLCLLTLFLGASLLNATIASDWIARHPQFLWHGLAEGLSFLAAAALVFYLWVLPSGLAYFIVQPDPAKPEVHWKRLPSYLGFLLLTLILFVSVAVWTINPDGPDLDFAEPLRWLKWALVLAVLALLVTIGLFHLALRNVTAQAKARSNSTKASELIPGVRVKLTQFTAAGLQAFAVFLGLGLLLWAAAAILELQNVGTKLTGLGTLAGGLVTALRTVMTLIPKKKPDTSSSPALADLAIGIGGFVALLALALIWAILAVKGGRLLMHGQTDPTPMIAALVGLVFLSWLTGQSFQFVNLTSIQQLYSSRIIRAYLGASNRARLDGKGGSAWDSISEPHPKDNLPLAAYYSTQVGKTCPLHLINVTVNETISPTDPLVQRDRKGLPMAITPTMLAVDGRPFPHGDKLAMGAEKLSLGNWIGISGAAFSTGLGRGTTLGKAILFTLANVRLGYWWSGWEEDKKAVHRQEWSQPLRRLATRMFRTQAYLLGEMFARFDGPNSRYWYLSDGGHYENTAVYEMLRRRVGLILASDNGADPDYGLEDLANLFRLARIDFGMECVQLTEADVSAIPAVQAFAPLIINPGDLDRGSSSNRRCLQVFWVYHPQDGIESGTALLSIKPRLVQNAPADVFEYARISSSFPQETTADQFFNEAQWESYRKLAQTIGDEVLALLGGPDTVSEVRKAFITLAKQKSP